MGEVPQYLPAAGTLELMLTYTQKQVDPPVDVVLPCRGYLGTYRLVWPLAVHTYLEAYGGRLRVDRLLGLMDRTASRETAHLLKTATTKTNLLSSSPVPATTSNFH